MSFEFVCKTKTKPPYFIMVLKLQKREPKQLFTGFGDTLNSSTLAQLFSSAEIPSVNYRKNTAVA